MHPRSIEAIIPPPPAHFVGDGFRVHNFIPSFASMKRMDPFLMLDYNSPVYFPAAERPRGVGVHPHRGFETVTIAYNGRVAHHDSSGGGGVISEGDVQWMTAASGLLHKEYHEESFSKQGGQFQMVQLWVNLPAKDKMSTPKYQAITHQSIPFFPLPAGNGKVEVIAGNFNGIEGAANTFTPINLFNVRLDQNASIELNIPAAHNCCLVVIEGKIAINEHSFIDQNNFVVFKNDAEQISIGALEGSIILVMSGEPINEPIVAQGPFVMNTREEIVQAFEDYQDGKFGEL